MKKTDTIICLIPIINAFMVFRVFWLVIQKKIKPVSFVVFGAVNFCVWLPYSLSYRYGLVDETNKLIGLLLLYGVILVADLIFVLIKNKYLEIQE